MDIQKTAAVWFSPTGGTAAVTKAVAAKIADGETGLHDVTVSAEKLDFGAEDLVVFGVPVFGGRVPAPAAERLGHLTGNGTPAVLLAVYGNRAFEDALLELRDLTAGRGFHPVAAGAFIARHSIVHEFGAGRPDAQDRAAMDAFAEAVRQKLAKAKSAAGLPAVTVPGNRVYRKYDGVPLRPSASLIRCGKCGKCAKNCPVGAIPPSDPRKTDTGKCISCMRCVSVCPHDARSLNSIALAAARVGLKPVCSVRKSPETFL